MVTYGMFFMCKVSYLLLKYLDLPIRAKFKDNMWEKTSLKMEK